MRHEDEDAAGRLLASCSALLCTDAGPQGTAFFVAPGLRLRQPMWSAALKAWLCSSARRRTSGAGMSPTSARRPAA